MTEIIGRRIVRPGDKYAIAVSRFNELVTESLLRGARNAFSQHGVSDADMTVVWVPGAFELPLVAHTLANKRIFAAVVTLGAVIRGATSHFDYVCSSVASGVAQASRESGVPIVFGVLTTDTIEQAIERSGTKAGNIGWDAACNAIELADVYSTLGSL
ncbi:MAG: 6,7-dimethyl-8-ribityllumazine synthase [Paenibacillaceae bacterium]|nr:6,7-dimethyl-8-ribityllumazine synthase [Paenibacillaceae bacterium]